jgi:hypothetical protein
MTDAFDTMVEKYRARMKELRDVLDIDGRIEAISVRDPSYRILLTRNSDPSSVWRVTSWRGRTPIGHREYDHLESSSPINSALQEFAGENWQLVRRKIPTRERERRIREANEGLVACAEAITKTPDDAGKAIFERSQRIWRRRLDALGT